MCDNKQVTVYRVQQNVLKRRSRSRIQDLMLGSSTEGKKFTNDNDTVAKLLCPFDDYTLLSSF